MKNFSRFIVNLFSEHGDRQGKGEPGNREPVNREPVQTPPVYSRQRGLSPEFIEKYGLSRRQAEVTEVLLTGKSDKEIAALLNIALNTVQVHLKHVYRKTGARGRFALMALVGLNK